MSRLSDKWDTEVVGKSTKISGASATGEGFGIGEWALGTHRVVWEETPFVNLLQDATNIQCKTAVWRVLLKDTCFTNENYCRIGVCSDFHVRTLRNNETGPLGATTLTAVRDPRFSSSKRMIPLTDCYDQIFVFLACVCRVSPRFAAKEDDRKEEGENLKREGRKGDGEKLKGEHGGDFVVDGDAADGTHHKLIPKSIFATSDDDDDDSINGWKEVDVFGHEVKGLITFFPSYECEMQVRLEFEEEGPILTVSGHGQSFSRQCCYSSPRDKPFRLAVELNHGKTVTLLDFHAD